jgi:menaquinone-dependent protoporphyrinogen oxidase
MKILVAYATVYGSTEAIAARIAEQLRLAGHDADARPVSEAGDLAGYDVFVVGSAAYLGHWQKRATEFVRDNRDLLASRPTWLFSSGPLGTEPTNAQGVDQRVASEPTEIPELEEAIHPRDHRVFFGALDPGKLSVRDRAIRTLPAGRALLPEGDFRNWQDIESWAQSIAHDLAPLPRVDAGTRGRAGEP